METEVQNWIFNCFVIVIDLLEIMESSLLNDIVFLYSLNRVEMRYFQCENINARRFEYKFILVFDTCLICIEKCQKLTIRLLLLFLLILLLSIFLTSFIFLSLFSLRNLSFWSLDLHSKVSHLFLVPIDSNRNIIFSKIIANETISIDIIDMETMIYWRTIIANTIWYHSYFLTIRIYWTTFDISNQWFRVFKSTR